MTRSVSIRTRITLGSAAVALAVIGISIVGIRINAAFTLIHREPEFLSWFATRTAKSR
jgi:hypothetical protein